MTPPDDRPQRGRGKPLKTLPAHPPAATVKRQVELLVKAPHRPIVVVIAGNDLGQRFAVSGSLILGRDPDVDIALTDPLVSWQHARIEDRGDGFALVDLGSTNGVEVNGSRGAEFTLQPSDKITMGGTVLRFEVQDAVEQAYDALLERLLNLDDLSGLYVRRKFDLELAQLIERQPQANVGLLMMDLDGIKKINDTHGHLFGAYVIGEAGKVIGRVLGDRGFASRFGGDEFVAALYESNADQTAAMGEQILRAIEEHSFEHEGIVLRPGISIGVASFPEHAEGATVLFQRADEALYRAKRGGKRQVSR